MKAGFSITWSILWSASKSSELF